MNQQTSVELLPCPFCGGEAQTHRFAGTQELIARCSNKDCGARNFNATPEEWNTRPPQVVSVGEGKRIAETAKVSLGRAREMVTALTNGDKRWSLSVPADFKRDPDLVILQGITDAEDLVDFVWGQLSVLDVDKIVAEIRALDDGTGEGYSYAIRDAISILRSSLKVKP